jgi:hypothetical protein
MHACAGVGRLLQEWSEETLHLALETLTALLRADATAAAAWEAAVSPAVLRIWADNVTDPLLALDAVDALQALAANPAALPALQAGVFCASPFHSAV